ncbi:HOOK protein-domain-containing protein, partial [Pyronema omphalodes]
LTRLQVEELQPLADNAMKYKDELDEANHNIDKLKKSLNAAEKYRKKLETMSEIELQNKTLEEQNAQLFKELRASEENAKQAPGLKRTVEQYKKQVARLESEFAEATRLTRELEAEKQMLLSKSDGAEYQKTKDQERIRNLEEKIRELESGVIAENAEEYGGDLGSEITFATKTKSDMKLKIARLEAEIRHLKDSGGVGADNVVLQHRLQDVERARAKLEEDYLAANTARLVAESQLFAIRSGNASEGYNCRFNLRKYQLILCRSEVMLKLRQTLVDAEKELSELKRKHSEVEAELLTVKRELVTAKSDLSLVGKDEVESLDKLKAAANTDLAELQVTCGDLQNKVKDLETDLDIKKSLLNTVLLEKDAISTKLSQAKDQLLDKEQDLSEMRATIATFRGSSDGRDAALELRVQKLQEKVEKRRIALNNSTEVSCIVSFIDYIASPNFI